MANGQCRLAISASSTAPSHHAVVEIHTVGAGGGRIAWVDAAGLLHVWPRRRRAARTGGLWLGGENAHRHRRACSGSAACGPARSRVALWTLDVPGPPCSRDPACQVARPLGGDAAAGVIRMLEQKLLHARRACSASSVGTTCDFHLGRGGRRRTQMHGAAVGAPLGCKGRCCHAPPSLFCSMGNAQSTAAGLSAVFARRLDRSTSAASRQGSARSKSMPR